MYKFTHKIWNCIQDLLKRNIPATKTTKKKDGLDTLIIFYKSWPGEYKLQPGR